jgi:hypothetical protein
MINDKTPAELIAEECDALRDMLLEKNRKYGNSALEPLRIASRASPEELILVRIDDKLSRLKSAQPDDAEDIWQDLLGYIVLLRVCRKLNGRNAVEQPDPNSMIGKRFKKRDSADECVIRHYASRLPDTGDVYAVVWDDGRNEHISLRMLLKRCKPVKPKSDPVQQLVGERFERRDGGGKCTVECVLEEHPFKGNYVAIVWDDGAEENVSLRTLQQECIPLIEQVEA